MPTGVYKRYKGIKCGFQKGHKINNGRKLGARSEETKRKISIYGERKYLKEIIGHAKHVVKWVESLTLII
jgi:hypothetical protein